MFSESDYSLADLPAISEKIVAQWQEPVLLFFGAMGAGKTTLIKSICATLGVVDEVSSPTYSLVNEYQTGAGKTIYHFDLYRIDDESEALDFGVEEYFESGDLCLIEWPLNIANYLPETFGALVFTVKNGRHALQFFPHCSTADLGRFSK